MKKIAVIGANKPLLPFFKRAKELEYEIHCFAWEEGAVCKPYADYFYPISFTEKDCILSKCQEIGIDGITSFSLESALPTVNYIAEKMNLVSNSVSSLQYTSNKYLMRDRLSGFDIKIPKYLLIKNKEELNSIELSYPLIVKPVDNGGSRGVSKVERFEELILAYERAFPLSKIGDVIIEEFIDGREFSVEYISFNDKHYNLTVTDKVTSGSPYFIELEHHQPANISEEIQRKIKITTEMTLSALSISNSPSHTELKIDRENNIYIIEVGPRMGGDRISSDLVELSTGYDFIKGALELAVGDFSIPSICENAFSGIYFYTPISGYVKDYISTESDFNDIIYSEINDELNIDLSSNLDRSGFFIYKSANKFNIKKTI